MLALPPLPAQGVERIEEQLLRARTDAGACFAWTASSASAAVGVVVLMD